MTVTGTPSWVRWLALAAAAVLAVVVGVAAALGGFDQRTDHILVSPGTEIDAHNLVFTLDHAVAQRQPSGRWLVIVSGQVRNPHTEALAPVPGDYGNFALRPAANTETAVTRDFTLGGTFLRQDVPPDNRPIGFEAGFTLDGKWELGDTVECAVFDMEYTDPTILGLGSGPYWNVDSYARIHYAKLPLTVVAAKS